MQRPLRSIVTAALLIGAAITLVALLVVSSNRDLTALEQTLFQLIILGAGLAGTYMLGQQAAQEAAQELMKPAAKSAFRRVLGLYASIERLSERIQELKANDQNSDHDLDVLHAVVEEQRAHANDAMEDWRDLVPEEVKQVEKRLRQIQAPEEVENLAFDN